VRWQWSFQSGGASGSLPFLTQASSHIGVQATAFSVRCDPASGTHRAADRFQPKNQATYEWAVTEAGFRDFAWQPTEVAPEDIARYGEAYWRDFHANGLVIGLICQK